MTEETKTIPELLGFTFRDMEEKRRDQDREKPYSELSYRARYLLYEDEARNLLNRYSTHREIEHELNRRFAHDTEYHQRILGGYEEMDKKMRAAGVIPKEEMDAVDELNRKRDQRGESASFAGRGPDKPYPEVEGFSTPRSILSEASMAAFMQPSRRLVQALGSPEKVNELVDAALEDDEFYKWLDDCIRRGDHALQDNYFHLMDVPERERPAIYRMLANRYLEWKHLG